MSHSVLGPDPERDIWSLGVMVQGSGQMGELSARRRRRRRHLEIGVWNSFSFWPWISLIWEISARKPDHSAWNFGARLFCKNPKNQEKIIFPIFPGYGENRKINFPIFPGLGRMLKTSISNISRIGLSMDRTIQYFQDVSKLKNSDFPYFQDMRKLKKSDFQYL